MTSLTQLPRDTEGYLLNRHDWSKAIAIALAEEESVRLSEAHWLVLEFLRAYYEDYQDTPTMRALVKALKIQFGDAIGNSQTLQALFPKGPAKQAAKLAGLPKPKRCL